MSFTVSFQGRLLQFRPTVRPMIALKTGVRRGFAVDCELRDESGEHSAQPWFRKISEYDVERLNVAAIDKALNHIRAQGEPGGLLMMSAAYSTLASPRGRRAILERAAEARTGLKTLVMLEITALDSSVPQSRLAELVGRLRPSCKAVFARLNPTRAAMKAAAGCNLDGASIEAAYLRDPGNVEMMEAMVLVLHGVGPRVAFHNLRTMAAITAARAAGATYASLDIRRGEEDFADEDLDDDAGSVRLVDTPSSQACPQ